MNVGFIKHRAGTIDPVVKGNNVIFHIPKHTWEHDTCELPPGVRMIVASGIKLDVPKDYAMLITHINEMPAKYGLVVDNQIIHHGDLDEIHFSVRSLNKEHQVYINEGEAIAVGILIPVKTVELVEQSKEEEKIFDEYK